MIYMHIEGVCSYLYKILLLAATPHPDQDEKEIIYPLEVGSPTLCLYFYSHSP